MKYVDTLTKKDSQIIWESNLRVHPCDFCGQCGADQDHPDGCNTLYEPCYKNPEELLEALRERPDTEVAYLHGRAMERHLSKQRAE